MLEQIEGSQAVARTVALCRPEVICAYPISPQTHIVEGLGELVKRGVLAAGPVEQRGVVVIARHLLVTRPRRFGHLGRQRGRP